MKIIGGVNVTKTECIKKLEIAINKYGCLGTLKDDCECITCIASELLNILATTDAIPDKS